MKLIFEDNRAKLISKSKTSDKERDGKTRYEKRLKSKFSTSVREYNNIDMNNFFKRNILTVNVPVRGETDNYIVTMSFGEVLDKLHDQIERNNGKLELRCVIRALVEAFNSDNVYVRCSCPDFYYRLSYVSTKNGTIAGKPQTIPSPITNPRDTKGAGCKHILLVLANTAWIIKTASVVYNYINYMEKHRQRLYQTIIYPAIYDKEYEEPVQLDIFDDELESETTDIDTSNKYARTRGQFQQGNKYRFTPKDKSQSQQVGIEDIEEEEENQRPSEISIENNQKPTIN